jgi:hypothetical protein
VSRQAGRRAFATFSDRASGRMPTFVGSTHRNAHFFRDKEVRLWPTFHSAKRSDRAGRGWEARGEIAVLAASIRWFRQCFLIRRASFVSSELMRQADHSDCLWREEHER